ncbi:BtrH N-terminal domain-containing protein [Pseudonocardia nematodicida]|uniref:BtrH N-terminal domain-containing protein n=1 Tax=Pseudonocardia nematodicida TaxID=1206997 RepID=A0ABV1K7C0_9PSEU
MTSRKQLKARIRARMARTGESYTTAHRRIAGEPRPVHDGGYSLRGGVHPPSAALANVLAHHGVDLGEPLVFGITGGPGAGYILWEFAHDDSRVVVLGFGARWQYPDRAPLAGLERLGIPVEVRRTGGATGATRSLRADLDDGPVIVLPDRYTLGLRHLPPKLDGRGGDLVVVHGFDGGRYHLDDRNLAPLSVPAERLEAARARVGSYKNLALVPRPTGPVPEEVLRRAVLAGIADCAEQLGGTSASFALPAWAKWARTVVDPRAAKGWPSVFADGRGLVGALTSVWEGVTPAGMSGGHLRDLTADFLDDAGVVLDRDLSAAATAWRAAAQAWRTVAEAALPADVPEFGRIRELTASVQQTLVADGDAGDVRADAAQLWALQAELDSAPPLSPADQAALFADLAAALRAVYEAERAAVAELTPR